MREADSSLVSTEGRRAERIERLLAGEVLDTELEHRLSLEAPEQISIAIGEPGRGADGWRLTHHQARVALPIALRSSEPSTRYADVALLAAILGDDLLATSLRDLYLAPLERERDGGEIARDTLRAYFAADLNVSSTAVALGVSRNTVSRRLAAIESRLRRPLGSCAAELIAVLRFDELSDSSSPHDAVARC